MFFDDFMKILMYLAPLVAVLGLVYYFLEHWKNQEILRSKIRLNKEYRALILPTRVQAYERMVLFLERIAPNHLVKRLNNPSLSAQEFQYILTKQISDEYEHNLSQQLFIETPTWNMITLAKDQVIQQVMQVAQSLPADAKAKDLAIAMLNRNIVDHQKLPTADAIEMLKEDFKSLLSGH